ncbi:hypothetical protein [Streptomyces sp. AD55]|uniref:hypothetical protein n=1 Tax=Streptomyces sp. AD55 TaxID=3242895 RepID=UPI003528921F
MPAELIRVRPAPAQRRAFAAWAVAQTPKVRTTSQSEFAVPPHLFVAAPERVLIGARVDGHRYVSPEEDAAREAARLLDCGLCYLEDDEEELHRHPQCTAGGLREAAPGEPLPEVPASSYGPGAAPLPPADEGDRGSAELVGEGGPETYTPLADTVSGHTGPDAYEVSGQPDNGADIPSVTSADTVQDEADNPTDAGRFTCPRCPRAFTTERGRDTHSRKVHGR